MQQPLKKNVFSLINILGLSTGLAACLLITTYVQEETHYDRFAARAKDIYRVDLSVTGNVAAPFAWWGMSQWLREFAYRVPSAGGSFRWQARQPWPSPCSPSVSRRRGPLSPIPLTVFVPNKRAGESRLK